MELISLLVILFLIALWALSGHGLWVFFAWVFRGFKPKPSAALRCPRCGCELKSLQVPCPYCGWPEAQRARAGDDLAIARRSLERLRERGAIDPQACAQALAALARPGEAAEKPVEAPAPPAAAPGPCDKTQLDAAQRALNRLSLAGCVRDATQWRVEDAIRKWKAAAGPGAEPAVDALDEDADREIAGQTFSQMLLAGAIDAADYRELSQALEGIEPRAEIPPPLTPLPEPLDLERIAPAPSLPPPTREVPPRIPAIRAEREAPAPRDAALEAPGPKQPPPTRAGEQAFAAEPFATAAPAPRLDAPGAQDASAIAPAAARDGAETRAIAQEPPVAEPPEPLADAQSAQPAGAVASAAVREQAAAPGSSTAAAPGGLEALREPPAEAHPAEPSRPLSQVLMAFLEEKHIRWGELIGAMLIVGCSTALVVSLWSQIAAIPVLKFSIFTAVTAALFGAGLYSHRRWRLPTTSQGLLVTAALLTPLTILAMAAFSREDATGHPAWTLIAESAALLVLTLLTWQAGKVIAPRWPWLFTVSVIGPAASIVAIARTAESLDWPGQLALGALPLFFFALATLGAIARERRSDPIDRPTARAAFALLGCAAFAAAVAVGLLLYVSADAQALSPLLGLFAAPPLFTGIVLWQRVRAPELVSARVAGCGVAIASACLVLAGLVLAFPRPACLLPSALSGFAVLFAAAWLFRLPALHMLAWPQLALACAIGHPVLTGRLAWQAGAEPLLAALGSPSLGVVLAGLAGAFALISWLMRRGGRGAEGLSYATAAVVMALLHLALVFSRAFGSDFASHPGGAAWALGLYAISGLALAVHLRSRLLGWAGALLGPLAAVQLLVFEIDGIAQAGPVALLAWASVCLGLAVGLQRCRVWIRHAPEQPVRISLLACAGLAAIGLLDSLGIPAAHELWAPMLWLAALALGAALLLGWDWLYAAFQIALLLASEILAVSLLARRAWFAASTHPLLHPWSVQTLAAVLGGLALLLATSRLLAVRWIGPERSGWRGALRRFVSPWWPSLDRFMLLLTGLVGLYLLAMGTLVLLVSEHAVLGAPLGLHAYLGAGTWLVVGLLAALFACALWEGQPAWPRAGLFLSALAAAALLADLWSAERASATALRFFTAAAALVASLPLWSTRLSGFIRRSLRWPRLDPLGRRLLLALVLAASSLGVFVLSACQLVFHASRPLAGSIFSCLGPGVSIAAPLVLIAAAWTLHGIERRAPGLVFCGGLWLVLAASGAHGLTALQSSSPIEGVFWLRLAQYAGMASGLFALGWKLLGARRPALPGEQRLRGALLGIALAFDGLALVPALACLIAAPAALGRAALAAGDVQAWLAALPALLALLARSPRALVDRLPAAGLVLVSLAALGVARLGTQPALLVLLLGGLGIGWLVLLSAAWIPRPLLAELAPRIRRSALIAAGFATVLALRSSSLDLYPWAAGAMLALAGLVAGLAGLERRRSFSYLAALYLLGATSCWWVRSYWQAGAPLDSAILLLQANAIALCAAGFASRSVELGRAWRAVRLDGSLPALHVFAAACSLALLGLAIGAGALAIVVEPSAAGAARPGIAASSSPWAWLALILAWALAWIDPVQRVARSRAGAPRSRGGRFKARARMGVLGVAATRTFSPGQPDDRGLAGRLALTGLSLAGMAAMSVCPVDPHGGWLAFHTLLLCACAAAWLPLLLALRPTRSRQLTGRIVSWCLILGAFGLVLALRALSGDPARPWWSVSAVLALAGLSASLAWLRRMRGLAYLASGLWWLAVDVWWLCEYGAGLRAVFGNLPRFAEASVELVQVNGIAFVLAGLGGLWIERAIARAGPVRSELAPLPRCAWILGALAAGAVVVPAGIALVLDPSSTGPALRAAGSPWTWALLAAVAALAWLDIGRRQAVWLLAFTGLAAACAAAFSASIFDTGDWLAYHSLLGAVTAVAALPLVLAGMLSRPRLAELERNLSTAMYLAGALSLLLALRALGSDPGRPWWSVGAMLALSGMAAVLGSLRRKRGDVYLSALLLCAATSVWWLVEHGQLSAAQIAMDLLAANAAALALAGLGAWGLERRRAPVSTGLPGLERAAAFLAPMAMALAVGLGLILDTQGAPGSPEPLFAWSALAAACALALVNQRARLQHLFYLGLLVIGALLDGFDLAPSWLAWWAAVCLGAYLLVTGLIAGRLVPHLLLGSGLQRIRLLLGLVTLALAQLVVWQGSPAWLGVEPSCALWLRLGAASAALLGALGVGLGSFDPRERIPAALLGLAAGLAWGWAWQAPGMAQPALNRSVVAMLVLALAAVACTALARRSAEAEHAWPRIAGRLQPWVLGLAALAVTAVLGIEIGYAVTLHAVPMAAWAIAAVGCTLLGLAVAFVIFAVLPERDPFQLSERGRMGYVYAAEGLLALELAHVRLTMPWLFSGFFTRYWPLVVMGVAFCGVGLSELFGRRRQLVLAKPIERTSVFLPLLPVLGFWALRSELHYSNLLLLVGLLYGVLAVTRRSFGFGVLAALGANGGLWYFLHTAGGLGFFEHPQLWLIPAALSMLAASYLNVERLGAKRYGILRAMSLLVIYVSSTADIFINGVASSPWLPLVLMALSVAGVLAGVWLRVRSFLLLGSVFLLLSLITMIWHASAHLGWTWLWYVAGILLGGAIIVLFAVFEKKRAELLGLVEQIKRWDG